MEQNMADARRLVQELRTEHRSSSDLRGSIELLIKITRNALPPKDLNVSVDPKYLQLNPFNTDFNKKIWTSPAARQILTLSGWISVGEGGDMRLTKIHDPQYISGHDLMKILVENRNIAPAASEWVEKTKVESLVSSQEKFRRDQLRCAVERKAEYEKALREKKELKELAEFVKKQHRADKAFELQSRPRF